MEDIRPGKSCVGVPGERFAEVFLTFARQVTTLKTTAIALVKGRDGTRPTVINHNDSKRPLIFVARFCSCRITLNHECAL
jgi:hypothetical protein